VAEYWLRFIQSMAYDIAIRIEDEGRPDLAALVTVQVVDPGQDFTIGPLSVRTMATEHPPVPCLAYRFEGAGRSVVFSGDTAWLPGLADFARDADLLVHEAMLGAALPDLVARVGNGDERLMRHLLRSHTMAADAARIASAAGVGALALNHLIPSDDPAYGPRDWEDSVAPHWSGPLHVGRDGLVIAL
jgi:ribonuclease BN (tRNA processing enzyme)